MSPTQMKLRLRRRAAEVSQPEDERSRRAGGRSGRRKSEAAAAEASSPPPGSSSGSAGAEDASPDSKCPICLDRFNNLAYLDRCLHRFCFRCIQEWAHNKAECPLCKQPFASILHSVRAEDDFKEYTLQPAPPTGSVAATVAMVAAMASAARSNQQMRLMLRRHGGERRRGGGGPGAAAAQWLLDPPLPRHPPASPVLTDNSEEDADERRASDGADSPDGGVIFEGVMGLGGSLAPVAPGTRESRRMAARLAARRRMQQEGGVARQVRERETVAFRRSLYRCGVRLSGIPGQPQQQQDVSAESFRRNPELLSRLRPWLRRELLVLYGAHGSLVDIIQRIVMVRLARHGLEDTPTLQDELRPFLLARTDHFLHELQGFARSPLGLDTYDLQAVYEPPAAAELEAISSSSDSRSVIAISEGEEERGGPGGGDRAQTRSSLSQSTWDDETPGPSYSTAEPSCSLSSLSFSPPRQEVARGDEGGEGGEEGEEECLIVGYKKPMAERTPELVQLSSDSEEEEQLSAPPAAAPPLPHPPVVPPSTSGTHPPQQEGDLEGGAGEACEQRRGRKSPSEAERRRGGPRRKSSALLGPPRCVYPAPVRRRSRSSSSPLQSSESSPPDSSWEYSCSHASPLASSVSSPSRASWSSSPPRSPPHLTAHSPPAPSAPPGEHGEKPGGKRKYKSRHLDSNSEDPSWRPGGSGPRRERRRERRRRERRRRRPEGRRRGRSRRPSGGGGRVRQDRSPSVEIIYEGPAGTQPPALKRRRKPERTRQGSSPVIITLDSDGSDGADGPHALDLCQLLPLALPDGARPLPEDNPGFRLEQDHHVDVETVEGSEFLLGPEEEKRSKVTAEGEASDSRLLASILGDLRVAAPPRCGSASSLDGRPGSGRGAAPLRLMPDLPPLLKQVSPVRSYSRDTPPPLRRSDAPSPRLARPDAPPHSSNHKPLSLPGSTPQSASLLSSSPLAESWPGHRQTPPPAPARPSSERPGPAQATPLGGDGPEFPDDFVLSGDRGTDGHVSAPGSSVLVVAADVRPLPGVRCRSAQTPSSASAGALRSAHEDPPPFQTARLKCGVSAALASPVAPPEARLSAEGRPDLLADSQEAPPPVDSH